MRADASRQARWRRAVGYTIRPLRWRDALTISRWHYDGQYAYYDMNMLPVVAIHTLLRLVGVTIYYAAFDGQHALIGFFSFVRHGETVEIGLALRPDLTGKGMGLEFVREGMAFARQTFQAARFSLTVATFNQRARRVYERAGFRPVRTFTASEKGRIYEFEEMIREA